jgi:hypothetical protein
MGSHRQRYYLRTSRGVARGPNINTGRLHTLSVTDKSPSLIRLRHSSRQCKKYIPAQLRHVYGIIRAVEKWILLNPNHDLYTVLIRAV